MKIEIFTDGACSGNGKDGAVAGYAWALLIDGVHKQSGQGRIENGTNNIGELTAAISGLTSFFDTYDIQSLESELEEGETLDIIVITDSQYVLHGATDWSVKWKKQGWYRNTARTLELKNKELWIELDNLLSKGKVSWRWVRGHTTTDTYDGEWNDFVDKLAQAQTKGGH